MLHESIKNTVEVDLVNSVAASLSCIAYIIVNLAK
jgi:hypothetical protein